MQNINFKMLLQNYTSEPMGYKFQLIHYNCKIMSILRHQQEMNT